MTAHTRLACYAEDCPNAPLILVKLNRRNEALLAPPDFGACGEHWEVVMDLSIDLMLGGAVVQSFIVLPA